MGQPIINEKASLKKKEAKAYDIVQFGHLIY